MEGPGVTSGFREAEVSPLVGCSIAPRSFFNALLETCERVFEGQQRDPPHWLTNGIAGNAQNANQTGPVRNQHRHKS